jgi:hypothetical protein
VIAISAIEGSGLACLVEVRTCSGEVPSHAATVAERDPELKAADEVVLVAAPSK